MVSPIFVMVKHYKNAIAIAFLLRLVVSIWKQVEV